MFSSKLRNMFTNTLQPLEKEASTQQVLGGGGGAITYAIYKNKTVTLSHQHLLWMQTAVGIKKECVLRRKNFSIAPR